MSREIPLEVVREIIQKVEDRYPEDVFQDIGGKAMRHACRVMRWEINEYLESQEPRELIEPALRIINVELVVDE